jgi:hypothetical protein
MSLYVIAGMLNTVCADNNPHWIIFFIAMQTYKQLNPHWVAIGYLYIKKPDY